jgi:hypothetical protein
MFFIHIMGRRSTAATLDDLGSKMTAAMASQANDAIVVSVGKTDQAVMPYVWIRRDSETDEWEGELGDSIKLGIEDGLLNESDPIQMMGLNEAIEAGLATVEDDGLFQEVRFRSPDKAPKPKESQKLSNEEKEVEAKRMVDNLFKSLK